MRSPPDHEHERYLKSIAESFPSWVHTLCKLLPHELRHLRKSGIEGRGIVAPGLGEVGTSAALAAHSACKTGNKLAGRNARALISRYAGN